MRFTIIVPVYNTAAYLEGCIAALLVQDYPRDRFEILMVDNNSTDGSSGILRRAHGIRALSETTVGSYAARNRALRDASGEIIAFTDSDCFPGPGWLRAIEGAFENPRTQLVLGSSRPGRDRGLTRLFADYENKKAEVVFASDSAECYYGFTNNMGVRGATMNKHGPFVERPRGADTIFVRRVVDAEGSVAVTHEPSMRVVHAEIEGVATCYRKIYTYGRSYRQLRHLMVIRALSTKVRVQVFRRVIRDGSYSWLAAVALGFVLVGGAAAWSLGRHSLHRSKTRPAGRLSA